MAWSDLKPGIRLGTRCAGVRRKHQIRVLSYALHIAHRDIVIGKYNDQGAGSRAVGMNTGVVSIVDAARVGKVFATRNDKTWRGLISADASVPPEESLYISDRKRAP